MKINFTFIEPEQVRTAWHAQQAAKVLLAKLKEDLGVNPELPARIGRYRIHKDKNGLRIENLNPEAV